VGDDRTPGGGLYTVLDRQTDNEEETVNSIEYRERYSRPIKIF
jgi:hypothetical protein